MLLNNLNKANSFKNSYQKYTNQCIELTSDQFIARKLSTKQRKLIKNKFQLNICLSSLCSNVTFLLLVFLLLLLLLVLLVILANNLYEYFPLYLVPIKEEKKRSMQNRSRYCQQSLMMI